MRPENVLPENFQHNGNIVYTSADGWISLARGQWIDDAEGVTRLAIRWNGDIDDPEDKGYPKVFGNPMWFQLPSDTDIPDLIQALTNNI